MAADTTQPFEVTVKAAKADYAAGKELELQVSVRNTTKETAKLQFNSGQKYDFSARKAGENELSWLWSMDKIFTQALSSQEVKPGEVISFKGSWPSPAAGEYTVVGIITANGRIKSAPITVIIK
ncbi:hypothetical protein EON80_15500 [bacterium]|nr:MAG: hypothetical protein EON80_15500 [bacterium]